MWSKQINAAANRRFEIPIWVLYLFLPFFMISIYLLFSTVNGLKPRFLGEQIKAKVIEIDSIEFNRKGGQNIIYKYYGSIRFEYRDQWVISKYKLDKGQKVGNDMTLYYHEKHGFYNPFAQKSDIIMGLIFSIILSVLSCFYCSYFREKCRTKYL